MEDDHEQAAAHHDQVHNHHQHQHQNNHYDLTQQSLLLHATKPIPNSTCSLSYFPTSQLDHHPIYPALPVPLPQHLFFNTSRHDHYHNQELHQQSYPDEIAGATGAAGYLAAGGLLESCSVSDAAAAMFNVSSSSNTSRWPREETMSLLQIRSRLHSDFKQATHKGPLWEEVSRIMYDEHGYQRSGKKCREKFENLYKYYKKTKEAKSGKNDGKHYRFFRQLEALYGDQNEVCITDQGQAQPAVSYMPQFSYNPDNRMMSSSKLLIRDQAAASPNNNQQKLPCDNSCLSLSNTHNSSHDFATSSSSEDINKQRGQNKRRKWKVKIKEFIDTQMKSLVEQQQLCMERVMETIVHKDKERVLREEEWRKKAEERLEREQRFWASERAWMEARDATLMETFQRFTGSRSSSSSTSSAQEVAARAAFLASQMKQIPASSSVSHMMHKKQQGECNVRNSLALNNNQETQDGLLMGPNHHQELNSFRFLMSDAANGAVGSLLWDGSSSFGLKLNNSNGIGHQS